MRDHICFGFLGWWLSLSLSLCLSPSIVYQGLSRSFYLSQKILYVANLVELIIFYRFDCFQMNCFWDQNVFQKGQTLASLNPCRSRCLWVAVSSDRPKFWHACAVLLELHTFSWMYALVFGPAYPCWVCKPFCWSSPLSSLHGVWLNRFGSAPRLLKVGGRYLWNILSVKSFMLWCCYGLLMAVGGVWGWTWKTAGGGWAWHGVWVANDPFLFFVLVVYVGYAGTCEKI